MDWPADMSGTSTDGQNAATNAKWLAKMCINSTYELNDQQSALTCHSIHHDAVLQRMIKTMFGQSMGLALVAAVAI